MWQRLDKRCCLAGSRQLYANTVYWTLDGQRLHLEGVLPQQVGESKELRVCVGTQEKQLMRLLLRHVPAEVAILLTDAPTRLLSLPEAPVLLRERWQMELLYKRWKQDGQIDEWRTSSSRRVLCELYARRIGLLLQHWLMLLFAWHDEQHSLAKLARMVRDTACALMESLAGIRSLRSALRAIRLRMGSGTRMNKRRLLHCSSDLGVQPLR